MFYPSLHSLFAAMLGRGPSFSQSAGANPGRVGNHDGGKRGMTPAKARRAACKRHALRARSPK